MKKKTLVTLALVAALVVVFGVSFAIGGQRTNGEDRFVGTDAAATAQIQAVSPGYEPWFTPFFQPQSGEVESGLFALQAAIGGCVLGFAIGALWARRRPQVPAVNDVPDADPADAPPAPELVAATPAAPPDPA